MGHWILTTASVTPFYRGGKRGHRGDSFRRDTSIPAQGWGGDVELASGGDGWTSGAKTAEPVFTPRAPPGALVLVLTVSTWGADPREEVMSVDQEKPGTRKPGSGCLT